MRKTAYDGDLCLKASTARAERRLLPFCYKYKRAWNDLPQTCALPPILQ